MKFTFVIPVYIARPSAEGWQKGDTVFDHPTALDTPGTLSRTLESLQSLEGEDFQVLLVIAAVSPDIDEAAVNLVKQQIARAKYCPTKTFIFSNKNLQILKSTLTAQEQEEFSDFFSFDGYSRVRNVGFMAATLLDTEVVIWLDDDELIHDRNFLSKLKEGFSQKIEGILVRLITGACPEGETGSYLRVREMKPWMRYWNKIKYQNEAFEKIIGVPQPRWKVSPFAHGGLSAIHQEVFSQVLCDPLVSRGEDMDFNMNAKMFGFNFYLDNTLEIRHCPPPRIHPQWRRVREDAIRFLWQRNKIKNQRDMVGMSRISAEDFDPYPGHFLKGGLDEMIEKSQQALAEEYRANGQMGDAEEALYTLELIKNLPLLKKNAFEEFLVQQGKWKKLMAIVKKCQSNLCEQVR